jgi:uncharacterized protein (DUF433 family)
MAHETVDLRNRIVRDPAIQVGRAVVRDTGIPVTQILAMLAANPDVDELVRNQPALTHDDVRAALSYAHDRIEAENQSLDEAIDPLSPQAFYDAIAARPDVAKLMRRLAH